MKCPICTIDNLDPRGELGNHIIAHGDEAGMYLRDLIIKIHEMMNDGRTLVVVADALDSLLKDEGGCQYPLEDCTCERG